MKRDIRTLIAVVIFFVVCSVCAEEELINNQIPVNLSVQEVAGNAAAATQFNEANSPTVIDTAAEAGQSAVPLQGLNPGTSSGKSEQELLAELREVSTPDAPGWWPPAPGWWGLAIILIILLMYIVSWLRRRLKSKRLNNWKKSARAEHQRLSDLTMTKSATPVQIISQASILMRRVSLTQLPRTQIASATDDQWLSTLDRLGKTREYSEGVGQLLTRHPYMRNHDVDYVVVGDLLKLMRNTIDVSSAALLREDDRHVLQLQPVNNEAAKVV